MSKNELFSSRVSVGKSKEEREQEREEVATQGHAAEKHQRWV